MDGQNGNKFWGTYWIEGDPPFPDDNGTLTGMVVGNEVQMTLANAGGSIRFWDGTISGSHRTQKMAGIARTLMGGSIRNQVTAVFDLLRQQGGE